MKFNKFQDVFTGLGSVEGEYNTKANSHPTIQPQRNAIVKKQYTEIVPRSARS